MSLTIHYLHQHYHRTHLFYTKLKKFQNGDKPWLVNIMHSFNWHVDNYPLHHVMLLVVNSLQLKQKADGSINLHNAWLVAKGFPQIPETDYGDTFSPIVKETTVHTVLTIVINYGWPIRQLVVQNAFVIGDLTKEVCMINVPGLWILIS